MRCFQFIHFLWQDGIVYTALLQCDLDAKVRSSSAVSLSNAGISLRNAVSRLVLALAPVFQASCPGTKPNFEFNFDNPSDGYDISS